MAGFVAESLDEREITLYHHILFGIFGLAPWNVTSALFAQLPLILPSSPQMAQLPSFMDVATNLGNVPMLLYLFFVGRSAFAKRQPQSLNAATIYVLFVIALLTAAGFTALWDVTVYDFSVYVVLFALCGGIVGDVMMVTTFPWLTQFHPHYTSSFATGLSGHGLLTNGLAVIQDVGGPSPRFGVGGFMLLVAAVQLVALVAFDTLRRQRSTVAASEAQRGKGWGRGGSRKTTGDELLDGEQEGLTDGEEGREIDDQVAGSEAGQKSSAGQADGSSAGSGGGGSSAAFSFLPLLASQAWTNYIYFLIPSLLPYISRLPELRGLGMDPRTGEPNGSDALDPALYMWLNFITTAACGLGSLATIWVDVPHPGRLNFVMTLCFAAMFAAAVANIYADPPIEGSLMAMLQGGNFQLFACFWTSLLNGYIKTYIYSHVADVRLPPGSNHSDASAVSRYHQVVSRRLSTASQLAALSASVSMFILGPITSFLPH